MANYIHQVQTADGTVFDLETGQVLPNVNIKTINNTTMVGSGNISLPTFGAIASATAGLASNAAVAAATSQLATTAAVVSATSDLATNGAVANATAAMATTGYVDEQIAAATGSIISSPFEKEIHGAITRIDTVNTVTIATDTRTPTIIGFNNTVGPSSAYWGFVVGTKHTVASNAAANYVFVAGNSNKVTGNYASVVGWSNQNSGDCVLVAGQWHQNSGNYSTIVGSSNKNTYAYNLITGRQNIAGASYQTIIGKWNAVSSTALFIVGAGINNNSRKNAFEVTPTGIQGAILANDALTSQLTVGSTGQFLVSNQNELEWAKGIIVLDQNGYLPFGATQLHNMVQKGLEPVFVYVDNIDWFSTFISFKFQTSDDSYSNSYIKFYNLTQGVPSSPERCKFSLSWQDEYDPETGESLGYAYQLVDYEYSEDHYVQQNSTGTNNDYRVLLSYSANDTTETAEVRKSSNLTFNPVTGQLTVTGALAVTGEITSFGSQVLTVGSGLLWADNSGEDAEMLADNISIQGYDSVFISTSANQDKELSISSDYITLTSPQYEGEIGLDDTGVYISNSALPIHLNGYDIEIFAGGGSGIAIDNGDTITVTSYADVDFNVDGNLNYNGNLIATQNWVTNQVIGAMGGSY